MKRGFGQINLRLDRLENDMVAIKRDKSQHEELVDFIGAEMQKVHEKFVAIDERFDIIDERFEGVHARISLETVKLHDKIDVVSADVSYLKTTVSSMSEILKRLENRG